MSDFFENILSRTFGGATEIKPRLPARFESADRIESSAAEPWPLESEEPASEALPPKAIHIYRLGAAMPDKPPAQPFSPHDYVPKPQLKPASPPIEAGSRPGAEPTSFAILPLPLLSSQDHAQSEAPKPELPPHAHPLRPVVAAATKRSAIQGDKDRPAKVAAERVSKAMAPVSQFIPAERNRLPEAKHAAAQPTIVHVTIGRVEIRVQPPASPRPATPRPASLKPACSLDDYLRRRTGGER